MSDLNYVIGNYGQTIVSGSYPNTVQAATITTSGFPVQITVTGDGEPNSNGWQRLQIYRDSTPISEILHVETGGSGYNVTISMAHIDTPVTGTYTYSVRVVNGSGVSIRYTESGQLSMIVEEKIISSYLANNWLRREIDPPYVYYGYSSNLSAQDSDDNWSIKKVTLYDGVETVTWSNGSTKTLSIWNNRIDCFESPTGTLDVSSDLVDLSGSTVLQLSWSILSGVDVYQVIIADSDSGVIYSEGGYPLYNTGSNAMVTKELYNIDNYTFAKIEPEKSYDVTIIGVNVAGNVSETITVTT